MRWQTLRIERPWGPNDLNMNSLLKDRCLVQHFSRRKETLEFKILSFNPQATQTDRGEHSKRLILSTSLHCPNIFTTTFQAHHRHTWRHQMQRSWSDCSLCVRACVSDGAKEKRTSSFLAAKWAIIITATIGASTRALVTLGSTPPRDSLVTDVQLFCASNYSLKLCKRVESLLVRALITLTGLSCVLISFVPKQEQLTYLSCFLCFTAKKSLELNV